MCRFVSLRTVPRLHGHLENLLHLSCNDAFLWVAHSLGTWHLAQCKLKMQAVQSAEVILQIELGPLLVCVDLHTDNLSFTASPSCSIFQTEDQCSTRFPRPFQ